MIAVLFPIQAIAAALVAYLAPQLFTPFQSAVVPLLAIIMFGMGLTLTLADFKRVARRPAAIGLGILLQFTVMPVAAFAIDTACRWLPSCWSGWSCWEAAPAAPRPT